jgi:cytochrome oxidase Cu insertion factor (SCO1/SenC/PrrC family)
VVIASASIVVGGFLLVGCGSELAAGRVAPVLELTTVDGEPVALSDYLGRPVAVTFMHSY